MYSSELFEDIDGGAFRLLFGSATFPLEPLKLFDFLSFLLGDGSLGSSSSSLKLAKVLPSVRMFKLGCREENKEMVRNEKQCCASKKQAKS